MSTAIALGRPNDRPFACTSWPSFEPGTWASASVPRPGPSDPAPIVAADRDAGAVEAARVHVSVAGVEALVTVEHAALSAQRWPTEPSLVVCNPPYGRWVGGRDLRDLYAALGSRVSDGGHRLCLPAADDGLARATGSTWRWRSRRRTAASPCAAGSVSAEPARYPADENGGMGIGRGTL